MNYPTLRQDIVEEFAAAALLGRGDDAPRGFAMHRRRGPGGRRPRDREDTRPSDHRRACKRAWMRRFEVTPRRRAYKASKARQYALAARVAALRAGVVPKKWGRQWRAARAILEHGSV